MVRLNNISFAYPKAKDLFSNLNLKLESGNIYGLLGKNGAGKTSLLKIICGLLFSQQGNSEVVGFNPKLRNSKFLANVYFVAEDFYLPSLKISKFIELYSSFYPRFDRTACDNYLKEFEVTIDRNLQVLSYGQKKKVLLAFALASNCELVIFDEPTNGLDIPSKSQFRKLLATAITDTKTFIIATHQVREVEHLIDPIIIVDDGKIIFQYSMKDIAKHLSFTTHSVLSSPEMNLYAEKIFNGYRVVSINKSNVETDVDIEMLFNAVLLNKDRINAIFARSLDHD